MRSCRTLALAAATAAALVPLGAGAQELRTVGNRQCAIQGTELHTLLSEQLPGCELYCTVENELVPGYETYPGLVFACADRRGAILPPDDDPAGLSIAGIGAIAGIGLLLGLAGGGGNGGSTSDTQ